MISFAIPTSTTASVFASVSDQLNSFRGIAALVIGLPAFFWIVSIILDGLKAPEDREKLHIDELDEQ